jgi:sorting nexin-1/2
LMTFEEPIKEYVRIIQSIKTAMVDRATAYRLQKELTETYKLKELNLEKLKLVRPDKVAEAEAEVREIRIQSTDARMRFEEIVKLMAQEMERFQEEKTRDLGSILLNFARAQAQLAADTADAWRTLLPELDAVSQAELTSQNSSS